MGKNENPQQILFQFTLEMGKNPHLLGSVLFGFYEYQGSVRFRFLSVFYGGF